MIEIKFFIHSVIQGDAITFFKIGIEVFNTVLLFEFFAYFVDVAGILAVGDGHYSGTVVIAIFLGIAECFFHP